jgi:hypothetical protein
MAMADELAKSPYLYLFKEENFKRWYQNVKKTQKRKHCIRMVSKDGKDAQAVQCPAKRLCEDGREKKE